jgi:hypothetical protein
MAEKYLFKSLGKTLFGNTVSLTKEQMIAGVVRQRCKASNFDGMKSKALEAPEKFNCF